MKRALSLTLAAILVICVFAMGAIGVSADAVDATGKMNFNAFENPIEFSTKPASANLNCSDADVRAAVDAALGEINTTDRTASKGHAVVTLNGKAYTVQHYANSGDWYRLNIEDQGAVVISGVAYTIKVEFFDENNNLVVKAGEYNVVSGLTSSNFDDKRTGLNVEADTSKMTAIAVTDPVATGIKPWNDVNEGVAKLFDGDTGTPGENSGTKLGGNGVNGTFDVTFKTAKATVVHYYTLYTGNDTAGAAGRNPIGWTLFGSNDNGKTWTVIDTVAASEQKVTGLGAANATPYTYKAASPAEYTSYKITFRCAGGDFQMNELKLFNDPNAKTDPVTPPTQGGTENPPKPAPTGDIALVLSVVSLIAVAGAVVIAKKRKIED